MNEDCRCGHRYARHTYYPNRFPCLECSCHQFDPRMLSLVPARRVEEEADTSQEITAVRRPARLTV